MTSNFSNTSRYKHKIIFLGDQHTGKTCIIERFMYDVFNEKLHVVSYSQFYIKMEKDNCHTMNTLFIVAQTTVGVDFLAKTIHVDDRSIRLQLWDTAGQERFRSLIASYLRDATCAVIVFDVTSKINIKLFSLHLFFNSLSISDKESFTNIDRWIKDYKDNRGPDAPAVLVANKIDLKLSKIYIMMYI